MRNLKIAAKLTLTFAIIIVLLAATAIVAIVGLVQVSTSFDAFYEKSYANTYKIVDVQRIIQKTAKDVSYGINMVKPDNITNYAEQLITDFHSIKTELQVVYDNTPHQGVKDEINEVYKYYDEVEPVMEQISDIIAETAIYAPEGTNPNDDKFDELNSQAMDLYFGVQRDPTENSKGAIGQFLKSANALDVAVDTITDAGVDEYETAADAAKTSEIILVVVAIIAVIVSVVFAIYITVSIKSPVTEIEHVMGRVLTGDFSARVGYQSKDELGSLANSVNGVVATTQGIISDLDRVLNLMSNGDFDVYPGVEYVGDFKSIESAITETLRGLSNTILQIGQAAEQVATGSDQVSNGAQALSQGATEQASSVEELAATINNINEHVNKTAENSRDAAHIATETGSVMDVSSQKMQDMIAAMGDISNASAEIGKIIKTIEDIAFQTNILALNASVEAARAGAAGKGFAVVANEVGSLANKSAEASKSTAGLIEGAIKAVNNGTKIADETANSLFQAAKGAKDVLVRINEISKASEQQAESISQVTQGVDQISAVVQTNSATAEESAAASEQLSSQSQLLSKLVSVFKPNKKLTQGNAYIEQPSSYSAPSAAPSRVSRISLDDKY